jgi:hypothetical protein
MSEKHSQASRKRAEAAVAAYLLKSVPHGPHDKRAREVVDLVLGAIEDSANVNAVPQRAVPRIAPAGLRLAAVAGVLSNAPLVVALLFNERIRDAFDSAALERGLVEIGNNVALAQRSAIAYEVSAVTLVVFLAGIAFIAKPPGRSVQWVGAGFAALGALLDLPMGAALSAVAGAAHDSALHAANIVTLAFVTQLDSLGGNLVDAGFILLGVGAWRSRSWPRWVAVLAVLSGVAEPLLDAFALSSAIIDYALGVLSAAWTTSLCVLLWREQQVGVE